MSDFYDDLETRSQDQRESIHFALLRGQLNHAKIHAPFYRDLLAEVDPDAVVDRAALAKLPVTRKSDLLARQAEDKPFGGLAATATGDMLRVFVSPGPIAEPEGDQADYWRMARGFYAAGFRQGDVAINCFSYHHTPAGHMMETGLRGVGCATFPGGTGQSEAQAQAISHFGISGYTGTPDFLKVILDKAEELNIDVSSLNKAMVGGGALFPSMREEYDARGVAVLQNYGTADLGLVAYESPAREGMILDEGVIVEILRPGTGDPVEDGEVGEVVVTLLDNPVYPLIRFATGDLSAIMEGTSPCGRTNRRIKGWMGRADQRTKVKGMFVDPAQVDRVMKRHPEIAKLRLEVDLVDNADRMTLKCEADSSDAGLIEAIAASLQAECKLKGGVELVSPGSLPNDGKVIDDQRSYD